jgi:threonine/homoserine/homoserine lactone efflux protein
VKGLSTVLKGLRFGMLLQLAVGPVCLFVANAALTTGFWPAMGAVAAVVLTDAIYITLSALGAATLLARPRVRRGARILGGVVLCVFGLDMALGAFGVRLLHGITLLQGSTGDGLFLRALILTAGNPLTILFWGGALTAQMAEHKLSGPSVALFSFGCLLATLIFLTAVAAAGGALVGVLSETVVLILNGAVGIALVIFGLRLTLNTKPIPVANKDGG